MQAGHEAIIATAPKKSIKLNPLQENQNVSGHRTNLHGATHNCATVRLSLHASVQEKASVQEPRQNSAAPENPPLHSPPAPLRAPPTSPNSASPQLLAPVQAVWDGLKAIGDPWNFIFSIFEIEVNIFDFKRDPTTVF